MSMENLKRAAAYIRVSTGEQTEFSPESQLDRIMEYASKHGYCIDKSNIFTDSGISGKSTLKRAAFQSMIEKAKKKPKPFEAILVWKFSRFARNREDSIIYKSMLRKKYGVKVISVSEDIGEDKLSLLIEAMIEAMDEFYSLNLGEEVKRGMKKRAEKGKFQSRPPFGYRLINGNLVPDEFEQEYVQLIFSQFLAGRNPTEISRLLNSLSVKTSNGNDWNSRSVSYVLKNHLYAGYVRWNKSGENPVLKKGIHKPIIDEYTFQKTNGLILAKSGRKHSFSNFQKPPSEKPFYLELMRCSACGGRFCLCGDGKNLQCINYIKKKCSVSHSISLNRMSLSIEKAFRSVFDYLGDDIISIEPQNFLCCHKYSKGFNGSKADNTKSKLLNEAEKRYQRAKEAYNSGVYTLEELKEASNTLERIRKKLFSSNYESSEKQEASAEYLKNKLHKNENCFDKHLTPSDLFFNSELLSREEKLALLSSFVERIVFCRPKEALEIFFYLP